MRKYFVPFLTFIFSFTLAQVNPVPGSGDYKTPFFNSSEYPRDIQSPSEWLGFELGGRAVTPAEAYGYLAYLDEVSSNSKLVEFGQSYEGRPLAYLIVTSQNNYDNLDKIKSDNLKLADPRKISSASEAEKIISASPAIAWMAYTIHGDELSGTDAALFLAYQLAAGEDEESRLIREELVVLINPLQNPDGRQRFTAQMVQWNGATVNDDNQSMAHGGSWPWGRGNHYFFDLNRDWVILEHPEVVANIQALTEWYPQLAIDGHEMGSQDTYLFNPPREPFNPYLYGKIHKWWKVFAADQADAFDEFGWSYYTGEWSDEFYPGYGSSWPMYQGAIGILYEQAGVEGSQVKRYDGTTITYRESVHHQFVSSWANLMTAAKNSEGLLRDFYRERKKDSEGGKKNPAYIFPPGNNTARFNQFLERLKMQDVEIFTSNSTVRTKNILSSKGTRKGSASFPAGTVFIPLNQPNRDRIESCLTFDIRLTSKFLETERKSLLKHNDTRLYEVTGWSMPLAYDIEAYYGNDFRPSRTSPWVMEKPAGGLVNPNPNYGYLFSNEDDNSALLLAKLLNEGIKVRCAREPFSVEGRNYGRGTCLIRVDGNQSIDEAFLDELGKKYSVVITGANTALSLSGSDLGGNDFVLLQAPRIAVLAGSPVSTTSFSATWYLIDNLMETKVSLLETAGLGRVDLRKYNIIIVPSSWGGTESYRAIIGEKGLKKLEGWVRDGGTLIGTGNGAALLADTSMTFGTVRRQRQVLDNLPAYIAAAARAQAAEKPVVDSLSVWEGNESTASNDEKTLSPDLDMLKTRDELARKLAPGGVIANTILDQEHWLNFGLGKELPVLLNTTNTYLAKESAQVPVRFTGEEDIRLSGLFWPEARERWASSAYATRERVGNGQVVLFASDPYYRAYFQGGKRLFQNALLLGPGFGSNPAPEW